jgi:alkylhydroperoxidase/carboxymuconolactone decarboxylase family protein YurZ
MSFDPLAPLKEVNQNLYNQMQNNSKTAFGPGTVPVKYKLLAAMVLDAAHGATNGVTSLTKAAREAGATDAEIAEFLEVLHYVSGGGSLYTASAGLAPLMQDKK